LLTEKGIFISVLAGIFLGYLGYPSYVKYLKYGTVFTETRESFDPRKPVGITIFAWKKMDISLIYISIPVITTLFLSTTPAFMS
jgi:hypothetical protein